MVKFTPLIDFGGCVEEVVNTGYRYQYDRITMQKFRKQMIPLALSELEALPQGGTLEKDRGNLLISP